MLSRSSSAFFVREANMCAVKLSRRGLLGAGAAALALAGFGRAQAAVQEPTAPAAAPPAPPPLRPLRPSEADLLLKALADADTHGFRRDEFGQAGLADQVHSANPDDRRRGEALLISATLAYARAQRGGRIPKDRFPEEWAVRPAPYSPNAEFARALAEDRLGPWLASLPPPYMGYQGLRKALSTFRGYAEAGGWRPVAEGPPLKLGSAGERVVALRRRLAVEDPPAGEGGPAFDPGLNEAVMRFQARYGIKPDGVVGPPTLAALNAPVSQRIMQIEANLERWRWIPRELPPTRVQVNIAAAVLAVYQDDRPVLSMKAVAGRPTDRTPMLASQIESIVLNPPWYVPDTIANKEIWPKARRNPGYLQREDFVVRVADDGSRHLMQRAGPKSALGQIKFDFPNPFGVYLHDTPTQSTFGRTSRLASHGCVRLEHPESLAKLLLNGDSDWPAERIDAVIGSDDTTRVRLPHPVPVFLLYWTAFVDGKGEPEFRTDAYDWDSKLMELLSADSRHA